jgi:phosphate starvation-inducible membrane PsiE
MASEKAGEKTREAIVRTFGWVEDVVYVGLGVLLAVSAVALLVQGGVELVRAVAGGIDAAAAVSLLDRILLALMIVELLYTVLVSFREHTLVPQPFLLVALIAAVRRILVITAEFGAQARPEEELFRHVMLELALLTVLIAVLAAALALLRRRPAPAVEA